MLTGVASTSAASLLLGRLAGSLRTRRPCVHVQIEGKAEYGAYMTTWSCQGVPLRGIVASNSPRQCIWRRQSSSPRRHVERAWLGTRKLVGHDPCTPWRWAVKAARTNQLAQRPGSNRACIGICPTGTVHGEWRAKASRCQRRLSHTARQHTLGTPSTDVKVCMHIRAQ